MLGSSSGKFSLPPFTGEGARRAEGGNKVAKQRRCWVLPLPLLLLRRCLQRLYIFLSVIALPCYFKSCQAASVLGSPSGNFFLPPFTGEGARRAEVGIKSPNDVNAGFAKRRKCWARQAAKTLPVKWDCVSRAIHNFVHQIPRKKSHKNFCDPFVMHKDSCLSFLAIFDAQLPLQFGKRIRYCVCRQLPGCDAVSRGTQRGSGRF